MLGRRRGWRRGLVTCIACDATVHREDAREYDRFGDRWDRDGKEFEHLCKRCDGELCHQPRAGLESLLIELGAGEQTADEFLAGYWSAVRERNGSVDGSDRSSGSGSRRRRR